MAEVPSVAPAFEWSNKCLLGRYNMSYETYLLGLIKSFSEGFFGGKLSTNPKQEYLDHIERIKSLIPKEQLLIFDVKDGWTPLAEFLGV